jgi:hypothetical protein
MGGRGILGSMGGKDTLVFVNYKFTLLHQIKLVSSSSLA